MLRLAHGKPRASVGGARVFSQEVMRVHTAAYLVTHTFAVQCVLLESLRSLWSTVIASLEAARGTLVSLEAA